MDIRKFCKKRLHVEVEASDATATDTDVLASGTAADTTGHNYHRCACSWHCNDDDGDVHF